MTTHRPSDLAPLLTRNEAAEYLHVNAAYLAYLASRARGPAFFKIGTNPARYSREDLDAWLLTQRVLPTDKLKRRARMQQQTEPAPALAE